MSTATLLYSIGYQTEVLCEFPNTRKLQRISEYQGNPSIQGLNLRYPIHIIAVVIFTKSIGYEKIQIIGLMLRPGS